MLIAFNEHGCTNPMFSSPQINEVWISNRVLAKEGKGGGPPAFIAQIFFDVVSKPQECFDVLTTHTPFISELAKTLLL